jgi:glycosyltransferase involved in cell wall biosynthesis
MKPCQPEPSCIIPVLDRRKLIGAAIRSVLEQDSEIPVEIIVVDDGSSDGTPDFVKGHFPEVKLLHTTGRTGPGMARNLGVKAASGNILMFLDSDDTWLPCHVQELCRLLHRGAQVAYGVTLTDDTINGGSFLIPEQNSAPQGFCFSALTMWCSLVPSALAVTRQAFDVTGGFAGMAFGEDWHFFLRLSRKFAFHFTPRLITRRLLHENSLCASGELYRKIQLMLHELEIAVLDEPGASPGLVKRFRELEAHAARKGTEWKTVQDWYMSLKRHDLV